MQRRTVGSSRVSSAVLGFSRTNQTAAPSPHRRPSRYLKRRSREKRAVRSMRACEDRFSVNHGPLVPRADPMGGWWGGRRFLCHEPSRRPPEMSSAKAVEQVKAVRHAVEHRLRLLWFDPQPPIRVSPLSRSRWPLLTYSSSLFAPLLARYQRQQHRVVISN